MKRSDMNKLDRLLAEAKKMISGDPFLMVRLLPAEDCYQLRGYFTKNGREYTEIQGVVTEDQEGVDRIEEIKQRENIKEDDCIVVTFDYGEEGG